MLKTEKNNIPSATQNDFTYATNGFQKGLIWKFSEYLIPGEEI